MKTLLHEACNSGRLHDQARLPSQVLHRLVRFADLVVEDEINIVRGCCSCIFPSDRLGLDADGTTHVVVAVRAFTLASGWRVMRRCRRMNAL